MYFGLTQVQLGIIALAHSPGKIEDPGFGFKGKTQSRSKISIIDTIILAIVSTPSKIDECIEKRILTHQVSVLRGKNGELRKVSC